MEFDKYLDAINNPCTNGSREYRCIPISESNNTKHKYWGVKPLPSPENGFEWFYYSDLDLLSGYNEFVQLDLENGLVGNNIFLSMS